MTDDVPPPSKPPHGRRSFRNDNRGMKGVLVLGTAMFLLAVWYLVGAFAIEPFIALGRDANLAPFGGQGRLTDLKDIFFLYAPMAWLFAWFIWAVRYYLSPNKVVARRGGP